MNKYSVKQLLSGMVQIDDSIQIEGWVRSRRDSKSGLSFITLSDGSCFEQLQIVAESTLANYTNEILKLTKDCSIHVSGKVVQSLGHAQAIEILASTITVIGWVEEPNTYPASQKRHTVEYLRSIAHLRVRTNLISSATRVRNTVSYAIHQYLQNNGFYWIHTPLITTLDAEGAGELFKVTTLDSNKYRMDPGLPHACVRRDDVSGASAKVDYSQDFFGTQAFLTVSGQLHAESYCLAMSKVYTFGPAFRAENSNTTRHLAELWMIEPEIAFANLMDDAALAQDLLKYVFKCVLDTNADDMKFFADFVNKEVVTRLEHVVNTNFAMLSYSDVIKQLLASNKQFENPVAWGVDLASEHERYICEEYTKIPTIVTDYPKDIKAFYMRQNDDGKTVAAMDILTPGVGEIVGGSQREERYDVLVQRMHDLGIGRETLEWYLDLRRFGSVPHAGFGLGLERLVSYVTGIQNVRDVIAFPRTSGSALY